MKDTGNGKDDKKQIGGCYDWDGSEGGAGQLLQWNLRKFGGW